MTIEELEGKRRKVRGGGGGEQLGLRIRACLAPHLPPNAPAVHGPRPVGPPAPAPPAATCTAVTHRHSLPPTRTTHCRPPPPTPHSHHPPRPQDVEEALIKRDIKRQKLAESHDAPSVVARDMRANEVQMVRRRTKMMLPSPQVGGWARAAGSGRWARAGQGQRMHARDEQKPGRPAACQLLVRSPPSPPAAQLPTHRPRSRRRRRCRTRSWSRSRAWARRRAWRTRWPRAPAATPRARCWATTPRRPRASPRPCARRAPAAAAAWTG